MEVWGVLDVWSLLDDLSGGGPRGKRLAVARDSTDGPDHFEHRRPLTRITPE